MSANPGIANLRRGPGAPMGAPPEATAGMSATDLLYERLALIRDEQVVTRTPFLEWAQRLPEPKAGMLDFSRYPFQPELYGDQFAEVEEGVVQKSTQVGVSAYLLRWVMYWPDTRSLVGLYVFPKLKQMYDFSDARVRPAIAASDYLRRRIPAAHTQNKGLKQIGPGFVYFRGSESVLDLESVDADSLALDEYDSLDNVDVAERRTSGSAFPRVRRVGVPSIPGWGISKKYEESDQRRWFVRCDRCGLRQFLDFWKNVDPDRMLRVCGDPDCRTELDVSVGEWVAEFPDRDVPGYHVPRLIVPHLNLKSVVEASRRTSPAAIVSFHNRDLGLPYAPKEGRLSLEAIQAAMRPTVHLVEGAVTDNVVTMGVDVASTRALNVRISEHLTDNTKKALWIGEVDSFNELDRLMTRFGVNMAAVDHLPERRLAMTFAERHPGRVYLVSYGTRDQKDVMHVDEDRRHVSVRRVEAIDALGEGIRSQRNLLPEALPEGYTAHLQALQRRVEEDEEGRKVVRYIATGPDDYAQAETYDIVANELWWYRNLVDAENRQELRPLDDLLEFEREDFNAPASDAEYRPGPDDEYRPGPG